MDVCVDDGKWEWRCRCCCGRENERASSHKKSIRSSQIWVFDKPDDDTDSGEIAKLAFVRERTITFRHTVLGEISNKYIIGSGLYQEQGSEGGAKITDGCSDHNITASAVRTQSDIRAFETCAAECLAEHGTAEARRAFNEDERWKHGPTYVFVDGIAKSGTDAKTFVYPPGPSREGGVWGEAIDDFGNDLFYEARRMTQVVDSGCLYYSFPNPATGKKSAKASYIIEIDFDGEAAVIRAGICSRDRPGTCYADECGQDSAERGCCRTGGAAHQQAQECRRR